MEALNRTMHSCDRKIKWCRHRHSICHCSTLKRNIDELRFRVRFEIRHRYVHTIRESYYKDRTSTIVVVIWQTNSTLFLDCTVQLSYRLKFNSQWFTNNIMINTVSLYLSKNLSILWSLICTDKHTVRNQPAVGVVGGIAQTTFVNTRFHRVFKYFPFVWQSNVAVEVAGLYFRSIW